MTEHHRTGPKATEGELLRLLAENVKDCALFVLDPEGRVQGWNPGAERLLGYAEDEIIGRPADLFFTPEDVQGGVPQQELRQALETGRAEGDRWCVRKDGSRFSAGGITTPLQGDGGTLRGFATILRDISERKRLEQILRRSEERQQHISEFLSDVTCVAVVGSRGVPELEYASENFIRISGYTLDELTDRGGVPFAIHPDDVLAALQGLERVLSGEQHANEIRMIRKDGEVRWIRYLAQPEWDADQGRVVRIRATAQDVTERKRAVGVVEESERRFRQLAENINEVFWLSDPPKARMLYVSPAYEKIWGRSCRSLYEQPLSFLDGVHPDDREAVVAAFDRHGRGELTSTEYRVVRPDGSVRWVSDRGFPIKDESGQVYRVAGIVEDVTERKRANEALKEADRRKDEFLAMLAHELRNPLAPIRNAAHVLRVHGPEDERLRWARDVIERQVAHMTRLVDDLLDVSRITSGKITLRKEPVDLLSVAAGGVETSRPLIESRGHTLEVNVPTDAGRVVGDATRLAQVVANLLNNAAKYTDEGGRISLIVEREGSWAAIRVRDTGIGIPPEMLPHVFDLFTQVDGTLERTQGGLGIGLTLVRSLVEMHGGAVQASSPGRGKGSEFVIRLPLLVEKPPAVEQNAWRDDRDPRAGGR